MRTAYQFSSDKYMGKISAYIWLKPHHHCKNSLLPGLENALVKRGWVIDACRTFIWREEQSFKYSSRGPRQISPGCGLVRHTLSTQISATDIRLTDRHHSGKPGLAQRKSKILLDRMSLFPRYRSRSSIPSNNSKSYSMLTAYFNLH